MAQHREIAAARECMRWDLVKGKDRKGCVQRIPLGWGVQGPLKRMVYHTEGDQGVN